MEISELFSKSDAICFDFDSTIINYEGLDKLAKQKGCYDVVSSITKNAMDNYDSLYESLKKRLDIIKPTYDDICYYKNNISSNNISFGLLSLFNYLKYKNKDIFIISGGFEQLILPYVEKFNFPVENTFCNSIIFDNNGNYKNFDEDRLTCKSKGKNKVINIIKNKYKNIIMIGDGITDLETKDDVLCFIGYGGNCIRKNVKDNSSYYYTDFNKLLDDITKDDYKYANHF